MRQARRSRRPRLLVLTTGFPPVAGGIQTMVYNLCLNFQRFEVAVVAPWQPGAAAFDRTQPFPVTRTRSVLKSLLSHVPDMTLRAVMSSLDARPALVLAGHVDAAPAAIVLQHLLGVPWAVMTYGAELVAGWSPKLARRTLRLAPLVLTLSRETEAQAIRLGAKPARCARMPAGVAPRHLEPTTSCLPAAWQFGGDPVLLTVARLDSVRKGQDVVMRALPAIAERFPTVHYVIAGSGPMRGSLSALAESLDMSDRCTFTGEVSSETLMALYERADVFVMPSRAGEDGAFEGFGLVYIEANAHRKPVIAGRTGGTSASVVDGETGLLVDPGSPREVAEAAIRLLADGALRARLGNQGRERVEQGMTWPTAARHIEDLLLDLISDGLSELT